MVKFSFLLGVSELNLRRNALSSEKVFVPLLRLLCVNLRIVRRVGHDHFPLYLLGFFFIQSF